MVPFTLILTAFSGLMLSKLLLDDFFTPPAIYNFFWASALGALELGWVAYDPLGPGVWRVIGLSYLGFMGGACIVALYGLTRPRQLSLVPELHTLNRKRFEYALFFLFGLGVFGFVVQLLHLQTGMGLGTFVSDPSTAREAHTNVKYLGFFNILNVANFVLAGMYLILYKRPAKWVLLIMLWALVTTLVTTDRTRFFYMIIWSFYIFIYLHRRVNLTPKMIAVGAGTVLLLLGFFTLIAKMYDKEAFEHNRQFVRVGPELASLVDPYIYFTGSFPVLQAFIEDVRPLDMGLNTFGPVVKFIELVNQDLERAELAGKFYRVPIELNACTYLEPFYKDFGHFGILLGPLLLGILSMSVYLNMRQRKTLFSIYFASLLSFCVTISIFVNHFTQIATWYFVVVGYLVYRFVHSGSGATLSEFRPIIFGTEFNDPAAKATERA